MAKSGEKPKARRVVHVVVDQREALPELLAGKGPGERRWIERMVQLTGMFKQESDRGAALIAGAFVDSSLSEIVCRIVRPSEVADWLIRPNGGPLGSHSKRLQFVEKFTDIPKCVFQEIKALDLIRNRFAHSDSDLSFETEDIAEKASRLKLGLEHCSAHGGWEHPPRDIFRMSATMVVLTLEKFVVSLGREV